MHFMQLAEKMQCVCHAKHKLWSNYGFDAYKSHPVLCANYNKILMTLIAPS